MESRQLNEQFNDLSGRVATTESEVRALAHMVADGFEKTDRALTRLQDRENQPTNWVGIATLLIAVVAAMGTWVNQRLSPIEKTGNRQYLESQHEQTMRIERAHEAGRTAERLRWLESEQIESQSSMRQKIEKLEERLNALLEESAR